MILIALGANIQGPVGSPKETLEAALRRMEECGVAIERRSRWYKTSPVPASDQPDYVNGVISVRTPFEPDDLMTILHSLEEELGRTRRDRWEARVVDLDIISYHEYTTLEKVKKTAQSLHVPHPRLQVRRFVLVPLAEIAPEWRHPTLGLTAAEMLAELSDEDHCELLI